MMSVWPETDVKVGAVEAANSNTVFHAIVWTPPYSISTQIKAPSTGLVGAEKVVASVVKWYAFGLSWTSQAIAFDDDVNACCGI